ncbi:F-box associated interaction domain [Arabidopsis suecica]|uniref:F-box associated interaction domain n=1 Tax=Arabidopsis suecica TaxID=45249 RepID=A0A8T2B7M3_ARASU|nr:F-box associated interaction domain [Arabidopsis suecica]
MTMMYDISQDLLEEILSRVPITSLRAVKSTCKQWNDIIKDPSFSMKYGGKGAKEFLVIMLNDFRACLMSVNLHGILDKKDLVDPFIKQIGELNQVEIYEVFHCDGLLLCITNEDNTRLVVWNPYLEQTRWIQPINKFCKFDRYCMGYDNNNNNHKILRFFIRFGYIEYEIYNFMSNSWSVPHTTTNWDISQYCGRGVSLKGNTYFIAQKKREVEKVETEKNLHCFDFTSERFGPLLPLPFHYSIGNLVILSTVREEQLAVLFKRCGAYETKIWITTKIEPNTVSWSNLLKLDFKFDLLCGSFFVGKEEKVVVIRSVHGENITNNTAYMIGEDGYCKEVDLGESKFFPSIWSYVPSCVQIQ